MPQNYKCGICESKPDQLSHHKMHIDTQKHKDKRTIFELKLKQLSTEDLEKEYKTHSIQDIVNKFETKKIMKFKIKEKTEMESKKYKTNTLIFEKSINDITETETNESFKYKFLEFLGLDRAGLTQSDTS